MDKDNMRIKMNLKRNSDTRVFKNKAYNFTTSQLKKQ